LTGTNKGIHPTPIHLKIFSPHVLALTLVDLPGMAKVAVGDQPQDIESQIKDMSLHYIRNPNAIILAVTSANTDLANSDALQLAQTVDPYGNRTVGVLTKLDLMDPGTDASQMLQNCIIPLRRGYIGVVNRGQQDINSDLSIREGLQKELQFFQRHPIYGRDRSLQDKCGTPHLAKTLNTILMHHIRDCLPELKNRITHMMTDVQSELDALGTTPHAATSKSHLGGTLLNLLSKFATNFANVIDGRGGMVGGGSGGGNSSSHGGSGTHHPKTTTTTTAAATPGNTHTNNMAIELFGGARISYIFNDIFASSLYSVGAFDGLGDEEIRTTIQNANGTRPSLFVPEISFDILVKKQIGRLHEPGIQCVDLCYEELQRISAQSEPVELSRFPVLRERMVDVVSNLLKRCVGPTQMMVGNLVKIELAYINTSHPDFIGGSRAVARLMEKIGQENDSNRRRSTRPGVIHPPHAGDRSTVTNTTGAQAGGRDVGATPLSSSSLSNYPHNNSNDDDNGSLTETPARVLNPPPPPYQQYDSTSGGAGLMNFIFRAGNKPGTTTTTTTTHNKWFDPEGGKENTATTATPGGPPSIVHLPQVPDNITRETGDIPTDRERVEMEIIKSLISSYFGIVRKNFIDMVPKTIMYFLVNHVRDAMQNELVSELYRDAEIGTLMQEAEDIAQRRQTCTEMRDLLSKALEIVNEVRDFNTFK